MDTSPNDHIKLTLSNNDYMLIDKNTCIFENNNYWIPVDTVKTIVDMFIQREATLKKKLNIKFFKENSGNNVMHILLNDSYSYITVKNAAIKVIVQLVDDINSHVLSKLPFFFKKSLYYNRDRNYIETLIWFLSSIKEILLVDYSPSLRFKNIGTDHDKVYFDCIFVNKN